MAKFLPFDPLLWATDERKRGAGAPGVRYPMVFTVLLKKGANLAPKKRRVVAVVVREARGASEVDGANQAHCWARRVD